MFKQTRYEGLDCALVYAEVTIGVGHLWKMPDVFGSSKETAVARRTV